MATTAGATSPDHPSVSSPRSPPGRSTSKRKRPGSQIIPDSHLASQQREPNHHYDSFDDYEEVQRSFKRSRGHDSQPQSQPTSVARPSRFQEGSLTDKPSVKPPSIFMRSSDEREDDTDGMDDMTDYAQVDDLMDEYHNVFPSPEIAAGTPMDLSPQWSAGISEARDRGAQGPGVMHFGRRMANSFKPGSLWGKIWSDAKQKDGHDGQIDTNFSLGSDAVASSTPVPSLSHKRSHGLMSRLAMKRPSLSNLKRDLKRVRSDWSIGGSSEAQQPPEDIPPVPAIPQQYFGNDQVSTIRRAPSRYEINRQNKLSKRISNLEGKLATARRDLDEALVDAATPTPKLPSRFERFTLSSKRSLRRLRGVPDDAPSIPPVPSQYMAPVGPDAVEGSEVGDDTVLDSTELDFTNLASDKENIENEAVPVFMSKVSAIDVAGQTPTKTKTPERHALLLRKRKSDNFTPGRYDDADEEFYDEDELDFDPTPKKKRRLDEVAEVSGEEEQEEAPQQQPHPLSIALTTDDSPIRPSFESDSQIHESVMESVILEEDETRCLDSDSYANDAAIHDATTSTPSSPFVVSAPQQQAQLQTQQRQRDRKLTARHSRRGLRGSPLKAWAGDYQPSGSTAAEEEESPEREKAVQTHPPLKGQTSFEWPDDVF